jgi:hypothetical protein
MGLFSANQSGSVRLVQHTRELARIIQLPRRTWSEPDTEALARDMSLALKRPAGSMTLRPLQALALYELGTKGGAFCPIRVGGGKTLITLLAPVVADSSRPLMLLPAKLVDKTIREQRELAPHWPIATHVRIVSYESLGRANQATLLDMFKPDLIIADEAHKLKNRKAAVTRRVLRYMAANPDCGFLGLSGTITKRSLEDYAHVVSWCLPAQFCPVPQSWTELQEWADALDEKPGLQSPVNPGALLMLCNAEELALAQQGHKTTAARKAFRRRLVETPGVVASTEGFVGCSLSIEAITTDVLPELDEAFKTLRTQWETPDGQPLSDPMAVWRHARELGQGFYYKWDPRPPEDWLMARKAWAKACRSILEHNRRGLDSELQVVRAVDDGHYPDASDALELWRAVKDNFVPNTVPVWLDDSVIQRAVQWGLQNVGIIWTEHQAMAERLAQVSRLSYYGRQGKDRLGNYIEDHPADQPLIASIQSNGEGRNLQKWNKGLILSPPPNGAQWEQLLARMHRDNQEADEVAYDVMVTCAEHENALEQAMADAHYIEASTGQAQKLLYADRLWVPGQFWTLSWRWKSRKEDRE